MKQGLTIIFLLTTICTSLFAQEKWSRLLVEPMFHYGRVFKHTPKLKFDVKRASTAQELNFQWQTLGQEEWQYQQRYPLMGYSLMHVTFGNRQDLGRAFAFVPNITVPFCRREKTNLEFRVGAGVGYVTKTFDPISNTQNNAVSSNFNSAITFKFGINYWYRPNIHLTGAASFIHFSNGAATLPNFGINIPGAVVGIRYFPKPIYPTSFIDHEGITNKVEPRKFGMSMHLGLAFREYIVSQGPKYPIYFGSIGATYLLTKNNKLTSGIDFEYNKAIYEFGLHSFAFEDKKEAQRRSRRAMFFVSDEFIFGHISLGVQVGTYITPNSYLIPFPIATKLFMRYNFKSIGKPATQFNVTMFMKSHLIVAEYIGLGAGASF